MSQTVAQKSKKKHLLITGATSKVEITRGVKSVGELLAETHIGEKWFNGQQFLWNDEESTS